ncbi:MAG: DNA phosphorothioation system sulfurtransferase DndC [Gammaproteobacteria bacterium]|nr:DNA phosphorothioation system sulfurtransferase DndC [Gammaproteobacteria bacterium]MYC58647.1 DNA phosphorothioation system sulfurtransferase DndC [Gammaproteobacteria bacterium]MYH46134.1 DNA phosphorothioation system sulfurtransferase DndC [Gammaproteobacteria bacterium]MYL14700.1 DNA phosphorothioation system sulfurtransferase DndC [Gammaproteobacteria bacterium]
MTQPAVPISISDLPSRLEDIKGVIRSEYLEAHSYPWIVAYSGGKDSTLLLQLVWEVIAELPLKQRGRQVLVVGNDTLVESPLVINHLRNSLRQIDLAGGKSGLPISTEVTTPCIDQTFWVSVIGRGYIPPTRNFRWCTDRMKISPTNKLILRLTQEFNGAILLIGTRRAESDNRRRAMNNRGVSAQKLNPQGLVEGCQMFAPLADLEDNDVWMTLMQRNPPWGGTHRRLITLYRNAGGGECPLVVTKEQAPSCGSTSPRFGCWTCTVVQKDRSLKGLIDSGHGETDKLEALFDFREWLLELREDKENRLPVRRNGNVEYREDGSPILGPFKLEVRKLILNKLRELESEIGEQLILPAEIDCIEDVWWRDEIKEDARQALHRSLEAVV